MINAKIKRTYINPKYSTFHACSVDGYAMHDYLWGICMKHFKKTFEPQRNNKMKFMF